MEEFLEQQLLIRVELLQHFLQLRKLSRAACCAGLLCEIVPAPHGRKQLHESDNNSQESEMVPTTNAILTQRQVDW